MNEFLSLIRVVAHIRWTGTLSAKWSTFARSWNRQLCNSKIIRFRLPFPPSNPKKKWSPMSSAQGSKWHVIRSKRWSSLLKGMKDPPMLQQDTIKLVLQTFTAVVPWFTFLSFFPPSNASIQINKKIIETLRRSADLSSSLRIWWTFALPFSGFCACSSSNASLLSCC